MKPSNKNIAGPAAIRIRIAVPLAILLAALVSLSACTDDSRIPLHNGWKYLKADNPLYSTPAFDDSTWNSTDLPNLVDREKKRQTIWLRNEVTIPGGLRGKDIAFFVGKIWDVEQTYFNGVKIGASGREYPDFFSEWNIFRYYHIPPDLVKFDEKNVIAVRMFTNQFALWNDEPFISTLKEVKITTFFKRLIAENIYPWHWASLPFSSPWHHLLNFYWTGQTPWHFTSPEYRFSGSFSLFHYYMPDYFIMSFNTHDNLYYGIMSTGNSLDLCFSGKCAQYEDSFPAICSSLSSGAHRGGIICSLPPRTIPSRDGALT